MKHRTLRIISMILVFTMAFGVIEPLAMSVRAESVENVTRLADASYNTDEMNAGDVFIATGETELAENGGSYLIKICRAPGGSSTAAVTLKMLDITAALGTDYTITEYGNDDNEADGRDSQSFLDVMLENADELEEYNESDAVADGTADSFTEAELTQEEADQVLAEVAESLQTASDQADAAADSETAPEGAAADAESSANLPASAAGLGIAPAGDSDQQDPYTQYIKTLKGAKELATGVISDRKSMSIGNNAAYSGGATDSGDSSGSAGSTGSTLAAAEFSAADLASSSVDNDTAVLSSTTDGSSALSDSLSELMGVLNSGSITLKFAPGETEKYLQIHVKNNSKSDGTRSFTISMEPADETTTVYSALSGIALTIKDDEPEEAAELGFSASEYTAEDGLITLEITRKGALTQSVSAHISTLNGTAKAGSNYSQVDADIMFPFGIQSRHVKIPVNGMNLTEDGTFTASLTNPMGCELGKKAEVTCTVPAGMSPPAALTGADENTSEAGSEVALAGDGSGEDVTASSDSITNGERVDEALDWDKVIRGSESSSKSKGRCYKDGSKWIIYPEYKGGRSGWSNWSKTTFSILSSNKPTKFYKGLRIEWEVTGGWNIWNCHTYVDADSKIYDKKGKFGKRTDDIYFQQKEVQTFVIKENRAACEASPKLHLYSIEPIKKPFTIDLLAADELTFLDRDGNSKKSSEIPEDKFATAAQLSNGGSTSELYVGDYITVSSKDSTNYLTTLKSLSIVGQSGKTEGKTATIASTTDEFCTTLSCNISNDDNWLSKWYDYYDAENDKGSIKVKPVYAYRDTTVKVYENPQNIGKVTVNDGITGTSGSDAKGKYTAYTFHKGDFIRIKETVNSDKQNAWTARQVQILPSGGTQHSGYYDLTEAGNTTAVFYNDCSAIEIMPKFEKKENQLIVKVAKKDVANFKDNYGVLACPRTEEGDYYIYTVKDKDHLKQKAYVQLSAVCSDTNYIPVWASPSLGNMKFCQSDYMFYTTDSPATNVVTLTCVKTSQADNSQLPYCFNANVYYSDVPTGSDRSKEKNGTLRAAEGAVLTIDEMHKGASDNSGAALTTPMYLPTGTGYYVQANIRSGTDVRYENIPVSATGTDKIVYKIEETEKTKEITCYSKVTGTYIMDPVDRSVPYISTVSVSRNDGKASGNRILIDGKISTLSASLAQNGTKYTYVDENGKTQTRTENVKAVEFIVIEQSSGREKCILGKATRDGISAFIDADGTWDYSQEFYQGAGNYYSSGDRLFVRVTTDRFIGNGKSWQNGKWVDNPVLQQTTYPMVATYITFDQDIQKEPEAQSFDLTRLKYEEASGSGTSNKAYEEQWDLPFMGTISASFNIGPVKLKLEPTPEGLTKIYFGGEKKVSAVKKDAQGNRQPEDNPDKKAVMDAVNNAMRNMSNFAFCGGFFEKPDFDIGFGAYIYLRFNETGKCWEFAGFGGSIGFMFKWGGSIYWVIAGLPVYLGFSVDSELVLGFEGVFMGKLVPGPSALVYEPGTLENNFRFRTTGTFKAELDVYGGVGLAKVLGVRGGAAFVGRAIADTAIKTEFPNYRDTGGMFTIYAKFWLDLLLGTISYQKKLAEWKSGYYKDIAGKKSDDGSGSSIEFTDYTEKARLEASSWKGGQSINGYAAPLNSSYKAATTTVLQTGGYDKPSSQLMELNDNNVLLVYLDDDGTKAAHSVTTLKYSIYNDATGAWTSPQPVRSGETGADYQPNLCDAGDDVIITWMSRDNTAEFNKDTEFLEEMNIWTVRMSKDNHKLHDLRKVSDDDYYNCNPMTVYDPDTKDVIIYYMKSEVIENNYIDSYMPMTNDYQIVYNIYDGASEKWLIGEDKSDCGYGENELADINSAGAFAAEWKGLRFVNTSIDGVASDPNVMDFTAMATDGYAVYAYTVDKDSNVQTAKDRQLYLQVYDMKQRKTFEPIAFTGTTNVNQAQPKFVSGENGTLYLFWLENEQDVAYTEVSDFLKNGMDPATGAIKIDERFKDEEGKATVLFRFSIGNVFFGYQNLSDNPNLPTFKPFVDSKGNLYISWLDRGAEREDGGSAGQEIFASAMIGDDSSEDIGTAWSTGVQLTNTGKQNDEQALVIMANGKMLIVNDSYDLDYINGDSYDIRNMCMLATVCEPVQSLETSENLNVSETVPLPGSTVACSFDVVNSGLRTAKGYKVKVESVNGQTTETICEIDTEAAIVASGRTDVAFEYTLPDSLEDAKNATIKVTVTEKGSAADRGTDYEPFVKYYKPFEFKPVYTVSDSGAWQAEDGLKACVTVTNTGNVDSTAPASLVVGYSGVLQIAKSDEEVFAKTDLPALKAGESVGLELDLNVPDRLLSCEMTTAYADVVDASGEKISENTDTFDVIYSAPYNMEINGGADTLTVAAGAALPLTATYDGATFFGENTTAYEVADQSTAYVKNGILYGAAAGMTEMTATLVPSGVKQTVNVKVTKSGGGGGGSGGGSIPAEAPETSDSKVNVVFTDVPADSWYCADVSNAVKAGLFEGISETEFGPKLPMTRSMLWTVIGRMAGQTITGATWAGDAKAWVTGAGVSDGTNPDQAVTREQLVTMLYRYRVSGAEKADTADSISAAERSALLAPDLTVLNKFSDAGSVSDYAKKAMAWAVSAGIIKGDNNKLYPQRTATRAEVAAILTR